MNQLPDDPVSRLRAAMDDDDGSPPPLWDPKTGEQLIGTVLKFEERYSPKMNSQVRVAVIDDVDNDMLWSVWLSRNVLANEFERQSPRIGDTVGIKYFGKKEGRSGGQEYHHYSLRVIRAPGSPPPPPLAPAPPASPTPPSQPTPSNDDDDEIPY